MKKTDHNDHIVYQLSSGKTLAIAAAPKTKEAHEPAAIIEKALAALSLLEELKASVADDQMLSEKGRATKVDMLRPTVLKEIAEAAEKLAEFEDYVKADEVATFAPPALDKSDAVSALADMELRSYLRGLEGKDLHNLMQDLPNQPRIMEAVLRSPIPMGQITEVARSQWGQRVNSTDPHVKELQAARNALDWAKSALPHVANHIADGQDRVKLLADITATGKPAAAAVFGFSGASVTEGARRAEAMAQKAA